MLNSGTVLEKRTPLRSRLRARCCRGARRQARRAVRLPALGPGRGLHEAVAERGLDKAGIRLIGTGDITDDDQLNDMGDVALGVVTAHHYAARTKSAVNQKFVEAFRAPTTACARTSWRWAASTASASSSKASRPARARAAKLLAAMKGQIFEPARPGADRRQTRDIVHDMYIRKVERVGGELQNVEFDAIKAMKDPGKSSNPGRAPQRPGTPQALAPVLTLLFDGIAYGMLLFVLSRSGWP